MVAPGISKRASILMMSSISSLMASVSLPLKTSLPVYTNLTTALMCAGCTWGRTRTASSPGACACCSWRSRLRCALTAPSTKRWQKMLSQSPPQRISRSLNCLSR